MGPGCRLPARPALHSRPPRHRRRREPRPRPCLGMSGSIGVGRVGIVGFFGCGGGGVIAGGNGSGNGGMGTGYGVRGTGHGARRRLRRQGRWRRRRRRRTAAAAAVAVATATARVVGASAASAASAAVAVFHGGWGWRRRRQRRRGRRRRRRRRRWSWRRRRGVGGGGVGGLAARGLSARPNPRSRRGVPPCRGDPTRGIEPRTPTAGCCRGGPPSGDKRTAPVPSRVTPRAAGTSYGRAGSPEGRCPALGGVRRLSLLLLLHLLLLLLYALKAPLRARRAVGLPGALLLRNERSLLFCICLLCRAALIISASRRLGR